MSSVSMTSMFGRLSRGSSTAGASGVISVSRGWGGRPASLVTGSYDPHPASEIVMRQRKQNGCPPPVTLRRP